MYDTTRVVALVLWVAMLFVPVSLFQWLKDDIGLLTTGAIVIFVLVLWDAWTGFLLGLALLTGMYRLHVNHLNVFGWRPLGYGPGTEEKSIAYTTADHLERAQTNVVDKKNYEQEIIGIKGVYGEPVYGAQGLPTAHDGLPGLDARSAPLNYGKTAADQY